MMLVPYHDINQQLGLFSALFLLWQAVPERSFGGSVVINLLLISYGRQAILQNPGFPPENSLLPVLGWGRVTLKPR